MRQTTHLRKVLSLGAAALACLAFGGAAVSAQIVDNPGFKALPRPINYSMPLAPAGGAQAVIVYGKNAPWTQAAATAVKKAIQDWSGLKLEIVDDRAVTSADTWLLKDECRKTPMIVLGNAWENRVMHALGTRYLLQSNRTWPGGDRYLVRSIFEPFEADVNYLTLEASTQAGLDGAVAKLAELLKTFPKAPPAIPRTRVVAGVKDQWETELWYWWKTPPEMAGNLKRSVSELALAYKGPVVTAGDNFSKAGLGGEIFYYTLGGIPERERASTLPEDEGYHRATAAMYLLGYRATGGRTHLPSDHYGAMNSILGARSFMQAGILTDKELNEFENGFTLSAAYPNEYFYDHVGSYSGMVNACGGRHFMACLLLSLHTQDYVLHHCRLDDRTRKEVQRRYDGARKCAAEYIRSFRNNGETSCLGEDTMLQLYCMLHEGFLEHVRNGTLRQMADFYVLSSDNLYVPGEWPYYGCYTSSGGGFSDGPGGVMVGMVGRGIIDAAAYYYDDPQYRWLAKNWWGSKWMVPAGVMNMHMDYEGPMAKPTMYNGVRALPYDERMYRLVADRAMLQRWQEQARLAPDCPGKALDRVAFRDGMDRDDAYLYLAASQDQPVAYPAQNNSIARYTDLSEVWLFANTTSNSTWSRSVVSISNGRSYVPSVCCQQEALANLGEVSAVASREPGIAGTDWTRTIVHWKGHYFAVLDRMEALREDDFAFVCRWRSLNPASMQKNVWVAGSNSGNAMRIQNTDSIFQTAEHWDIDGSAAPYVLQQYKQARLYKGQIQTYQNLMYVSGAKRPDEFETRRAGATAMLVKGKTAAGDHLALIGTAGGPFPTADFDTDAKVYDLTGDLLHLAAVRSLKASIGGAMEEVFWSQRPVNMLLNCRTGQAELEIAGDAPMQVKIGPNWASHKPGRETVALAAADALPKTATALETLWNNCPVPSATVQPPAGSGQIFEARKAAQTLERPLRKLTQFTVASIPPSARPHGAQYIWRDTSDLQVTVTLPESTAVDCLRLVSITKQVPLYGLGSEGYGMPQYKADDFQFSLVLSDDGFQKDVRKIDKPKVVYEETPECYVGHFTMSRLPTWRVSVGDKARQVKLIPRAATKERAALLLTNLEVYESRRVDELTLQAMAVDLNGDGVNELVLGTSQCQLAAYDSEGKNLWLKDTFPGAIHALAAGDLDDNGKSEVLAYLSTEKLRRINGDGSERPQADITEAQLKYHQQRAGAGNITTLGVWGRGNPKNKQVVAWAEGMFLVQPDGTTLVDDGKIQHPQGVGRLVNLYPNEPEVLVTSSRYGLTLWASRIDAKGYYAQLGSKPTAGSDSGESRGLGFVQQVDVPSFVGRTGSGVGVQGRVASPEPSLECGYKGVVAALEGGVACYPISAFLPNGKDPGWCFNTGGVPAVAALVEDINGEGVPEVLLGRVDGFVDVLRLSDGQLMGLLSTGQPIVGMVMLKNHDGKPCLAVGTKMGVHLFGSDPSGAGLKRIGSQAMPVAAFVGPGGKARDRAYVVDSAGQVTVLILK